MFSLETESLEIPGVKLITFKRFVDDRGFFTETFRKSDFRKSPDFSEFPDLQIVQINESFSKAGTIRGLHFQWNPFMGKLVRPLKGTMFDILLDIRKNSPTYKKAIIVRLERDPSRETDNWIWAPPGMAHGFFCIEDVGMEYLCTGEYNGRCEASISPLAEDIDWSLANKVYLNKFKSLLQGRCTLSKKDGDGMTTEDWTNNPVSNKFMIYD